MQYFVANHITDDARKRGNFLSSIEATTYKLIGNPSQPEEPSALAYQDFMELVKKHHNPERSIILERFKFDSCICDNGESVTKNVTALRQCCEFCNLGDSLKDMLRDHLVSGINDARIK